jgi:hypothetical protein
LQIQLRYGSVMLLGKEEFLLLYYFLYHMVPNGDSLNLEPSQMLNLNYYYYYVMEGCVVDFFARNPTYAW